MSYASGGDGGHGSSTRPARMRPRFLPTGSSSAGDPARGDAARELMESESSDLSEQQFAASLGASGRSSRPRFVPGASASRRQSPECETTPPAENNTAATSEPEESFADPVPDNEAQFAAETPHHAVAEAPASASDFSPHPAALAGTASAVLEANPGTEDDGQGPQWRQEVAARLNHYHSRRTRKPPRYPSLALKFDPPVYSATANTAPEPPRPLPSRSEAATAAATEPQDMEEACEIASDATNVIEFPRPLIPPPPRPDELAEPMLDLPRILDAPETVPKQVPLGGIILPSEEGPTPSDLELPLPVAPLNRRILAAALDGVLVGLATLMFAYIADKIAVLLPSLRVLLGLGVALPAILWAVFQYVFLVYTGSTPGMRLSGLHLSDFDGSIPDRDTRRWRALAMALSAVSLGLGFLWCLLDEDTLCWHDRITRTYLDAGPSPSRRMRPGAMFPQGMFAGLRRVEAFLRRRDEETSQEPPSPPLG